MSVVTDPLADYLTRVRNGLAAQHESIEVPASRLKREVSRILTEQGYIKGFTVEPTTAGEVIKVDLRYTEAGRPVIHGLCLFSRSRRRPPISPKKIPRLPGG
ncbi:MAG: 30S ribosomal protein S8, partial [Solirubrobacterales bacterium]